MTANDIAKLVTRALQSGSSPSQIAALLRSYDRAVAIAGLELAGAPPAIAGLLTSSTNSNSHHGSCSCDSVPSCLPLGGMPDALPMPTMSPGCADGGGDDNCGSLRSRNLRPLLMTVSIPAGSVDTEIKFQTADPSHLLGIEILSAEGPANGIDDLTFYKWESSGGEQIYDKWSANASSSAQPSEIEIPGSYYARNATNDYAPLEGRANPMPAPIAGFRVVEGGSSVSVHCKNADATTAADLVLVAWHRFVPKSKN